MSRVSSSILLCPEISSKWLRLCLIQSSPRCLDFPFRPWKWARSNAMALQRSELRPRAHSPVGLGWLSRPARGGEGGERDGPREEHHQSESGSLNQVTRAPDHNNTADTVKVYKYTGKSSKQNYIHPQQNNSSCSCHEHYNFIEWSTRTWWMRGRVEEQKPQKEGGVGGGLMHRGTEREREGVIYTLSVS